MFAALYEGSDCKVSEAFINFATAEVEIFEISTDYRVVYTYWQRL